MAVPAPYTGLTHALNHRKTMARTGLQGHMIMNGELSQLRAGLREAIQHSDVIEMALMHTLSDGVDADQAAVRAIAQQQYRLRQELRELKQLVDDLK